MSNIVNINGKNFINDYIDFDAKDYAEYRYGEQDYRNYPESKCLVHIWQNSNDLMDFWDNMVSAHDYWRKQNRTAWNAKYSLTSTGYKQRIKYLRKKGVKLKTYNDESSTINTMKELVELRKIAMITVT